MDIEDVRVGDRCWCQWINGVRTDENGQNATVVAVDSYIHCRPDDHEFGNSWKVSVDSFFWRKPEAPPKPKRKVTKTVNGWLTPYGLKDMENSSGVMLWKEKGDSGKYPATITVEVEE